MSLIHNNFCGKCLKITQHTDGGCNVCAIQEQQQAKIKKMAARTEFLNMPIDEQIERLYDKLNA